MVPQSKIALIATIFLTLAQGAFGLDTTNSDKEKMKTVCGFDPENHCRFIKRLYEIYGNYDMPAEKRAICLALSRDPANYTSRDNCSQAVCSKSQLFGKTFVGQDGFIEWSKALGAELKIRQFSASDFDCEDPNKIVVFGKEKGEVKATGKSFESPFAITYEFSDNGALPYILKRNGIWDTDAFEQAYAQ